MMSKGETRPDFSKVDYLIMMLFPHYHSICTKLIHDDADRERGL